MIFVLKSPKEEEVGYKYKVLRVCGCVLTNFILFFLLSSLFLAQQTIIRDCLSSLSFRNDIPADKYEGCRPAAKDVRLAHYVNHTIKEHDVKRDYFTDVSYCFCFLDHRCNGAEALLKPRAIYGFGLLSIAVVLVMRSLWL